jgi:hypothetical protein
VFIMGRHGVAQRQRVHGNNAGRSGILDAERYGTRFSLSLVLLAVVSYKDCRTAADAAKEWTPSAGDVVIGVPIGDVTTMKVIVGEEFEGKTTPVFADFMETVVFRPYWNITPDIQAKETAPKIAADSRYMEANDPEYFKDGRETRIRQKPGPKHSLGLVNFLFRNAFNIYLHDTPDGALFAKDVRAFSHGCIRLEKPEALAQWALGWDVARGRSVRRRKRSCAPTSKVVMKRASPSLRGSSSVAAKATAAPSGRQLKCSTAVGCAVIMRASPSPGSTHSWLRPSLFKGSESLKESLKSHRNGEPSGLHAALP